MLLFSCVFITSVTLLQSKQTSCRLSCNQRWLGGDSSKKSGVNCALLLLWTEGCSGRAGVPLSQSFLPLHLIFVCSSSYQGGKRVMGGGCTRLDWSQGSPLIDTICVCWQRLGCVCSSQSDKLYRMSVKNPSKADLGRLTFLWPLWLNQAARLYFLLWTVV